MHTIFGHAGGLRRRGGFDNETTREMTKHMHALEDTRIAVIGLG